MPDLATAEKNSYEKKIEYLNAYEISSPEEAIEVLEELERTGGKLIKGSILEKGIENYLGKLEVFEIPGVINALENLNTNTDNEFNNSYVPTEKIDELVEDYENHLKNGNNDKEAVNKIYKDNKGKISKEAIENFVKRQKEIYQETLKKISEEKQTLTDRDSKEKSKVVDIKQYKEEKENIKRKAEIISKERIKLEQKIEYELKNLSENKNLNEDKKYSEDIIKIAREIANETVDKVIIPQYTVKKEKAEELSKKISSELPYAVLSQEHKSKLEESLCKIIKNTEANIQIEEKIHEVSVKIIREVKKDERFEEKINRNQEEVQEKIESAVREVVIEGEVLTESEQTNDLKNKVDEIINETKVEGFENNDLVDKTAIKTLDLELNKWIEINSDTVRRFRGEVLEDKIELEIWKENPDLSDQQVQQIQDYKHLIKEIYYSDNLLEPYKKEAVESVEGDISPGKINNAWTDLKGLTNLLKRKPDEVKEIVEKYQGIKKSLGDIKLPFNIKECRSFENILNIIAQPQISSLFERTQSYLGYLEKIDKFTGGFLGRIGLKATNFIVEKIGNQAVKAFAQNSLKIIAEKGLQEGVGVILKGILSGGVKAGASAAGSAAAGGAAATGAAVAGGAALSATGVGAIIVAAVAILGVVKKIGGKIIKGFLESLGIDSNGLGFKKFFQENFGGFLGGLMDKGVGLGMAIVALPTILVGTISATILTPIFIIFFAGLMGYQLLQSNLVSSLVPPVSSLDVTDYGDASSFDPNNVNNLNLNFNIPTVNSEFTRTELVDIAKSVLGLPYFWGGKYPHKGANPNWGKLTTVTAAGSWSTGKQIPLGLDCSGFVDWTYYQIAGRMISNGGGASAIYNNSTPISESDLRPGDIGFYSDGNGGEHVGLYIGKDTDGTNLFIQASGQTYKDVSKGLVAGQVLILRENGSYNGYPGFKFPLYGRPKVTFKND